MTTSTTYIAFQNNGGREHTNAKCGMTRTNHVHNMPYLTTDIVDPCQRCSGDGYREASLENITWAVNYAYKVALRSPYGVSSDFRQYMQDKNTEMSQQWLASQEG